jgi:hypothetical protein
MLKRLYIRLSSCKKIEKLNIIRKILISILFNLNFRKVYLKLKGIRNKYEGKRCFIFGNGPSLNKMDLELFKDEYTWGSNRCYLLYDRVSWKHNFFISVDTRVLPDIAEDVNNLVEELPETTFFFPFHFFREAVIKDAENICFYNEIGVRAGSVYSVSLNVPVWVSSVCTVTIAAIQMAIHLGFKEIYLVGCDTSYSIPKTVEYENDDPELIISTEDDDPNHFCPEYFGKQYKWHDPHVENMLAHYEQVRKICDEHNIKIFNATVGGNLEVFERANYLDVLKSAHSN